MRPVAALPRAVWSSELRFPAGPFFLPVGAHPPRRSHPFSRFGDPHPRRLDSPIFVLEALVPSDHQAARYQLDVGGDVLGSEESLSTAIEVSTDEPERRRRGPGTRL